jgi:carboxypeptidase Taq
MPDFQDLYAQLFEKLGEITDIRHALALLQWDQEVYMPPKGAYARGQQLATLAGLEHRFFTDTEMRLLIDALRDRTEDLSPEQAALVRETAHDLDRAVRIPESLVRLFAEAQSRAYEEWVEARRGSDFQRFQPHLKTMVDLSREKAEYLGYEESPYDALLDEYERGMTASQLRPIFDVLAARQSALVARIAESPHHPEVTWLDQDWNEAAQIRFCEEVLRDMGYDFSAGRQDKSVHPFTTTFDVQDVRITTRVNPRDFLSALSSSVHEGGHALYEQGLPVAFRRTPLADAPSLGIHESQSRLWENIIGRSHPFFRRYLPRLQQLFPRQLDQVTSADLYRAANRVAPSLIRVDADECTYNLHVILRFEIETALIEGSIRPEHVPELWNSKMRVYLGVDVPDDAHGCLQDIHWAHGSFGYFPTYALGNLYSAQLMEQAKKDIPDLMNNVDGNAFPELLAWLRDRIHCYGRMKNAGEIIEAATGSRPSPEPFLRYLEEKYAVLYPA